MTTPAEPATETGRALLYDWDWPTQHDYEAALPAILAIEAEAARSADEARQRVVDAARLEGAAAERERMRAMRHDYQTMPHREFPAKWPDWREYEEVLPTRCDCADCRLWRSGS